MSVEITEFIEIDPDSVHAVFKAANGTPFLMIKQEGEYEEDEGREKKLIDELEEMHEGVEAEKAEFCGDATCEVCLARAQKGKLSTAERKRIPKSSFAIPEKAPDSGSYPINDKAHARNALSRVAQHGTPEEKARVRRAVAAKYPGIGKNGKKKKAKKEMPGQAEREQSAHRDVPSPDSLMGQTDANDRKQPTNKDVLRDGNSTSMRDGGRPPQEGTGFGDTAPEKDLHLDEAKSQTSAVARKEEVDMKGDARLEGTDTGERAQSQTEANMRHSTSSGEGEGIRDQMTREREQAQKAFKFKVKKGGKKKRKKNAPLEISGAMKTSGPERVLSEALASKEFDDMNGAELAEVFNSVFEARDARKAEKKRAKKEAAKAKKKEAKKAAKKAAKSAATTPVEGEEAAQDAAKSISPEALVEGIGAKVEQALKESLAPLWGKVHNLEQQPARPRLAINNTADAKAVLRDQRTPNGASVMDHLKPLEDAFKAEKDPYKREKMGGELTKARLVIAERIRHGQPVSANDAAALAQAGQ